MPKREPAKRAKHPTAGTIKVSVRLSEDEHRRASQIAERQSVYLMEWIAGLVRRAIMRT